MRFASVKRRRRDGYYSDLPLLADGRTSEGIATFIAKDDGVTVIAENPQEIVVSLMDIHGKGLATLVSRDQDNRENIMVGST